MAFLFSLDGAMIPQWIPLTLTANIRLLSGVVMQQRIEPGNCELDMCNEISLNGPNHTYQVKGNTDE